jgi:hypothetical protein
MWEALMAKRHEPCCVMAVASADMGLQGDTAVFNDEEAER